MRLVIHPWLQYDDACFILQLGYNLPPKAKEMEKGVEKEGDEEVEPHSKETEPQTVDSQAATTPTNTKVAKGLGRRTEENKKMKTGSSHYDPSGFEHGGRCTGNLHRNMSKKFDPNAVSPSSIPGIRLFISSPKRSVSVPLYYV
jgi:hypothetical protein